MCRFVKTGAARIGPGSRAIKRSHSGLPKEAKDVRLNRDRGVVMPKIAVAAKVERSIGKTELKRVSRQLREAQAASLARHSAGGAAGAKERAKAMRRLLDPMFANSKAEIATFEKLRTRDDAEVRRVLKSQKTDAIKRSSAMKKTLAAALHDRAAAFEQLTIDPDPDVPPYYALLSQPFLIWADPLELMDDSAIVPGDSWAKVRRSSVGDANKLEALSFFYMWKNETDYPVVINIDSSIIVNGYCVVIAEGGVFPGSRNAELMLRASLQFVRWWEDPPTRPLLQDSQRTFIANLEVNNGGFFQQFTAFRESDVIGEFGVGYKMLPVPAGEIAIFEVSLWASYDHENGEVDFDFSHGDFSVRCPHLLVTVLTGPPMMASPGVMSRVRGAPRSGLLVT
jgi:hypothetical protein